MKEKQPWAYSPEEEQIMASNCHGYLQGSLDNVRIYTDHNETLCYSIIYLEGVPKKGEQVWKRIPSV